ncbi:putative D,D-dipeptide transport system permease protein DdpC [Paenibacillus konkukensis]|uniref:D,D-dipeptide transport system permease protein DdpC n=1 Tax=Paenibacillus konkukensis TaxID=2020716 RepID=A0ABY4RIR6_9BACL|nr:ABC transporter permease [Paenibacillus konkukensis]UQZ82302.1 putative D,D-dipeptide transport system permease protein DdpC [Paenibacillus konkukensis]
MKEVISAKTVWKERRLRTSLSRPARKAAASELFVYGAGLVILFILACALFPKGIAPYAPTQMFADSILQPPSRAHLLGTDYFGRDVFSLVVYGSRDSLFIGVASVLVGGLLGGTIGAVSGYIGGVPDMILMRFIEVLMTIPGILLALAIAAALGPHLFNIVFAVAVSAVPGYARVMRGQILSMKHRPFVTASRSIGASPLRMFWWHVLPNAWSPLLVMATIGLGSAILVGSGLSFLGLGVLKEIPDWGALLSQGRGYLTVAWWIATFPGLAITLFVLSVNLIGDRLRDALDPKKSRA